jgi:hypothetical protein
MSPDRFRECLDAIGWTQRGLAARLDMNERQVRRWATGATIPDDIAAWLDRLANYHQRNPAPVGTRKGEG